MGFPIQFPYVSPVQYEGRDTEIQADFYWSNVLWLGGGDPMGAALPAFHSYATLIGGCITVFLQSVFV